MQKLTPVLIFGLFLCSCKKKSINCGIDCSYGEEKIFNTSFNQVDLTNDEYYNVNLSGSDPDFSDLSSWEELNSNTKIGTAQISYEDGNDSQRKCTIEDEDGNNVLKFQIIEPHIKEGSKKKGRVQLNVNNNQCIREFYQKVKLKLHPDLAHLKNWEERLYWFSLFEFWNNADWTKEKYPFRVTVNLLKEEAGPIDAIHFHVKGDYKKNCRNCKWHADWEQENKTFAVPFGEWMEIELYIKEGDSDNGRFFMAITPEGGTKQTIFNLSKRTQHHKEKCPDGFTHMQPLKLYTSDKVINYMKGSGKELSVCWDDWEFWLNKQY